MTKKPMIKANKKPITSYYSGLNMYRLHVNVDNGMKINNINHVM